MYVKEECSSTIIIEKSRFIAYLRPCFSEEDYREYLKEIRKKHYDASHVCSAVIIGNIKRSSDDGEPAGTAGVPILSVLEKNRLDNTCALVVRYFGGIKLGAGGLIRAYGGAVSQTLQDAKLATEVICHKYYLQLSYETANKADRFIENNTILLSKEYDENVSYIFAIEDEKILTKLQEITKGCALKDLGFAKIEKML